MIIIVWIKFKSFVTFDVRMSIKRVRFIHERFCGVADCNYSSLMVSLRIDINSI